MIIDCHGHYTTIPSSVAAWRQRQTAPSADPTLIGGRGELEVSDEEIRETIEGAQLRMQRERGTDLTIFSPRASWMGHHIGNLETSISWSRLQNDLIRRVSDLFPDSFAPACQLPQTPGEPLDAALEELERCVLEMGFVACNVNPDPTGGYWTGPPLWDAYWAPLWEKLCELDVPAMMHVSASANQNFHTTGSHYLGSDTTVFMQALSSGFMNDYPGLRWIIPHGGGAVPYQWGRLLGMAHDQGWDFWSVLDHIYFDTCVYHQSGIDLLLDVVPTQNVLFGSEMIGAVRGIDPTSGRHFDDTKFYIDNADLEDDERRMVLSENALRVFPRLGVGT